MIFQNDFCKRSQAEYFGKQAAIPEKMKGASAAPFGNQDGGTIPITIALTYDDYAPLLLRELGNYLSNTICPKHPHDGSTLAVPEPLELTNSVVVRTVLVLKKDEYGFDTVAKIQIQLALAKCPICKSRFRILPADILPYKHYSLAVIDRGVCLYNQGHLSLRVVAWEEFHGERTPSHTTLHAWTEGLGAYWSGRCFGEVTHALPASRIIVELEIRFPQIAPLHSIPVLVNPIRYRSLERQERLEACQRFEKTCAMVIACFCVLNRLIVGWGTSFGFGFRTGILSTLFEHIDFTDMLQCAKRSEKESMTCPIPGRSPPGDLK